MKCTRIPMEAEVTKYELGKGLEDGFELFSDIVTKGWIITDKLLKVVTASSWAWWCWFTSRWRAKGHVSGFVSIFHKKGTFLFDKIPLTLYNESDRCVLLYPLKNSEKDGSEHV